MEERILFICTGNYYRSRFAEILFDHLVEKEGLPYNSYSKGLRLSKRNKGPLSVYTTAYLKDHNIDSSYLLRMPIPVSRQDFDYYDRIIAMDEKEHRQLMKQFFPEQENNIEYWSFADDYIEDPKLVLPKLETKVRDFVNQLKK
ncbi:low molecular weight phosphatase family protein [Joostella sp.]|uniref:arsenate-mycothiol transferase ArsC n=1 Tax=Joostella sp. TaxID=2231138 RepID=UPI003A8F08A8